MGAGFSGAFLTDLVRAMSPEPVNALSVSCRNAWFSSALAFRTLKARARRPFPVNAASVVDGTGAGVRDIDGWG